MIPQVILARKSVRAYSPKRVEEKLLNTLRAAATMINTHEAGLYFTVVDNDPIPFQQFDRSYGMFRNARNYIAVAVDTSFPNTLERAGFFAEEIVLKAVSLGLGTCFVGGTYSSDEVAFNLKASQRLLFLVLFGYPAEGTKSPLMARIAMGISHRKTMRPEDYWIVRNNLTYTEARSDFPYLEAGMQGLAAAPSSLNKRPVRVWVGESEGERVIRLGIPGIKEKQEIDLGIAKYNFALAAGGSFLWGNGAHFIKD